MALCTDRGHLVTFFWNSSLVSRAILPALTRSRRAVGCALLIENAERLEERHAVIHPVLVVLREAQRQEKPQEVMTL